MIIYTAITNHYDTLKAPAVIQAGARYVAYLDGDDYAVPAPWEVRPIEGAERNPRVTSRRYKLLPHRYFPEHGVSIWVDSNLRLVADLTPLLASLERQPFAAFPHPERDGVYDEANAVLALSLATQERVRAQMQHYRDETYPVHNGLFMGGLLVRRHHDPALIRAAEDWWHDVQTYSQRDQLSGMVALWRQGLTYARLPGKLADYAQYEAHQRVSSYV